MIFVTVGTHEQPFDRLVKAIDDLAATGRIQEEIFAQTGYCEYIPKHCKWQKFVSADEMRSYMEAADVVVTHGGPSSFIEAMAVGKTPVVVPRYERFSEHINNHQEVFVRMVAKRRGGIIPVYNVADLLTAIEEARFASSNVNFKSHNAEFCRDLLRLIGGL